MRRLPLFAVLSLVLFTVGCGDEKKPAASAPLTEAVSYLPKDGAAVVIVQTDPNGSSVRAALDLVRRFPGADLALGRAEDSFRSQGLDYRRDVKPLLGNPVAISSDGSDFVVSFVARDEEALGRVIDADLKRGARRRADDGATRIYQSRGGQWYARRGPGMVVASDEHLLRAALARHAGGKGLTAADLANGRGDLPSDALVTGFGSARGLGGLDRYAFTVVPESSGVDIELRAGASGGVAGLPIAPGSAPPRVVAASAGATIGVRDPRRVVAFLERLLDRRDPGRARARTDRAVRRATGVDVRRDIVGRLRGDSTLLLASGGRALRATATEPAALRRALIRIRRFVPRLLAARGFSNVSVAALRGGLTRVRSAGRPTFIYGVLGSQFVAGAASPSELRTFVAQPTQPATDAKGAFALRVPGALIASLVAARAGIPASLSRFVLARIGDLHGWISSSPAGLRGSFHQDVR